MTSNELSRRSLGASIALVLLLASAALAPPARALDANGFLPERGRGDVALSYTFESYDEFWVGETKVSDPGVGEVTIKSFTLWAQWGLLDDLAVVANLPHVDASSDGLGGFEDSGLQDLSVLFKYRFLQSGPSSLVGALGVRTAAQDYEANLPVDLGDNTTDTLVRLIYLYNNGPFYFSQQVGYDLRSDDAPDGIPLYTEIGYTAGRVTYGGFYARLMANDGTDIGDPGFTFPSNQEEYSRGGLKLYARIGDRFGVSAAYSTTFDGRNTGDVSGYSAGAVFNF